MILEKQTQSLIQQEGETQESIGMSLDLDSAQVLMQMLSKNLYSDAIGSTIRECASNALDSHRRAGTTDPIIVGFKPTKDGGHEFTVEDFGIGLDAEDVKNIISKYGKSTKRNSDTELGMMGLGFKAPLAYASSFYFVCRKDGIERKYMMYEGEEVNTIDLLYEKPTTDRNGVKIIIPVGWRDRYSFITKIQEQLAYFESVFFDVPEIGNDHVISRHDLFQFSSLAKDSSLHICLDNVYYPIDFSKLEIDRIPISIALRLGLSDGVFPTPNRESIRYTREAKEIILNKIKELANFFVNKYNESVKSTEDVFEALNYFRQQDRYIKFGEKSLNIKHIKDLATVKIATPSLKGLYYETAEYYSKLRDYIPEEYEFKHEIESGKFKTPRWFYNEADIWENKKVYIYTDRIAGIKKDYLKSICPRGERMYLIKKKHAFKLHPASGSSGVYDNYYTILGLNRFPKESWRERIKEFQYVQSLFLRNLIDLDKLEVPQSFIDSRKKLAQVKNGVLVTGPVERRKKLEGEVTGKMAYELERTIYNQNAKFVSTTIQMKTAHQNSYLMVYGGTDKTSQFDQMFKVFPKNTTRFMVFSERELTRLKEIELHNWIHIDKFMEGKHIVFRRAVTAHLISEFVSKYRSVFNKIHRMTNVSTDIACLMTQVNDYQQKYHMHGNDELYKSLAEIAAENDMYDDSVYPEFKKLERLFDSLPFLNPTFGAASSWGSEDGMTEAIRDLFKYYKHRVDWKHYNIKLNEELTPQPVENLEEVAI